MVIAAFAIAAATRTSRHSAGSLPALTIAAPPDAQAQTAACTKLLEKLQPSLDGLQQRIVRQSPSVNVTAWGSPPIILRCGVARPADLRPGDSAELRYDDGIAYDLTTAGGTSVFTTVDRGPYISISFPKGTQPANHLPTLSAWITDALPAVCTTDSATPDVTKLCSRRP